MSTSTTSPPTSGSTGSVVLRVPSPSPVPQIEQLPDQTAGPGAPTQDILILSRRDLANPEGGGSELYVEQVAARLVAAGNRVLMLCAAHERAPRDEVKDGVRYLRRGGRVTVHLWAALLLLSGRLGRRGTVLEVHNGLPFLARLWTRRRVVVLVHHVHREQWSVVLGRCGAGLGWWLESLVAPRVNRRCDYVAVSEQTRAELIGLGLGAQQIQVIYNGTAPAAPTSATRTSTPSLLVLGRVVPHKRVELVLEAVAALRDQVPGLRCEVAGEGYWLPQLAAKVAELGLSDIVTLHGRVSEQHKADLLASSWVHVVPSIKEGWGLSVVEAGVHGTPSVAFCGAGGLSESIQDGRTGLLVADTAELHLQLARLLADTELREGLGAAARDYARGFTWSATAGAFSHVLAQPVPTPR